MARGIVLPVLLLITLFSQVPLAAPNFSITSLGDLNVDRAFQLALPYLLKVGAQYGPEVVFTYGPWGILSGGIASNDDMPLVWLFNAFYVVCIFWILSECTAGQNRFRVVLTGWIGCILFPALWITGHKDSFFIFPIVFLAFSYFTRPDVEAGGHTPERGASLRSRALMLVTVALIGLASLIKFNIFLLATLVVGLILVTDLRRRRIPFLPLVFSVVLLTGWLSAGQKLENLAIWVVASLDLSNGYADAMAKGFLEPYGIAVVSAYYLGASLILVAGFAAIMHDRHRRGRIPLLLIVALICAVSVKHGIGGNQIEQALAVLAATLWFVALVVVNDRVPVGSSFGPGSDRGSTANRPTALETAVLLSAAGCLVFVAAFVNFPIIGFKDAFADIRRNVSAIPRLNQVPQRDRWETLVRQAQRLAPLEHTFPGASVDIYPQHTAVIIDREGLRYSPRPAYLSLNAHTRRLAGANADVLAGERAPDVVLFQVLPRDQAVNNRHPATADGPSWPLLLSRYDVVGAAGEFAVLRKRADVRRPQLRLMVDREVALGEKVLLPAVSTGLVWIEIDIDRTVLGSIIHAVYKSPHVLMTSRTTDGGQYTYQIVPELGAVGLLASPLVENTATFVQIHRQRVASENPVRSIELSSPEAPPSFWQRGISLRIFELKVSKATSGAVVRADEANDMQSENGDDRA